MITKQQAKEMWNDLLNQVAEPFEFGNLSYDASQVLELVDPIAYNEGFSDYIDGLIADGEVVEGFNDDEEE